MSHSDLPHDLPLGQHTVYPDRYAPELLFAVPRQGNRAALGLNDAALPFHGVDLWHAYELSWLDLLGKPVVALGRIIVPCDSPNLVESKSLKLYLNSLNQMKASDADAIESLIAQDLTVALDAAPIVEVSVLSRPVKGFDVTEPAGESLDALPIETDVFEPDATLLALDGQGGTVEESLHSHLFKSNCPVTGQPDWGTVVVSYKGPRINRASLLRYLISFRNHQGFHEHCAEMVFRDLQERCGPEVLTVAIHFLRRGGLDINPVRSTEPAGSSARLQRFIRQ